jgi:hypothetical protein
MICSIAHRNAFPARIIHNIRNKILQKQHTALITSRTQRKNWVTLTFHSPLVYQTTTLIRNTEINIAFRPTNTIQNHLLTYPTTDKLSNSGTYRLLCITCNKSYAGQYGNQS